MDLNRVPQFDDSVNTTGCCPKFNPEGWDGQELHFRDKPFVRATTRAIMHVPVNMGSVFERVGKHIEDADAFDADDYIVLSRDLSPWKAEHLFAATKPVAYEDPATLSGDFVTKVFEGPYKDARHWYEDMLTMAREKGGTRDEVYFFYTTCPKCAKAYGKNYVVAVARTD